MNKQVCDEVGKYFDAEPIYFKWKMYIRSYIMIIKFHNGFY